MGKITIDLLNKKLRGTIGWRETHIKWRDQAMVQVKRYSKDIEDDEKAIENIEQEIKDQS